MGGWRGIQQDEPALAGAENAVPLDNSHALPRTDLRGLGLYVRGLDAGLMPYNCFREQQLHCVPMKHFECFAFGIPVVSTPLIHLLQYSDLVYLGDTADEPASAVDAALKEPANSPKRAARVEIARQHSIENLAGVLQRCLPLAQAVLARSCRC